MMCWLAAACSVEAAHLFFMRACYPVPPSLVSGAGTTIHTWVDVELRVIGQHVAVHIKNPSRSWVHNLGPQQKSTFLPWTGVLKDGLGSIRGVVMGHLARTKMLGLPEHFWVARLLEDVVELVYMGHPLSVIWGLVRSLQCRRVVQVGRTWISLCKNRMVLDDKKDRRQKPRHGGSGARRGRSGGRRDSGWRNRGRGSVRKSSSSSSLSSSPSRRKRRGKQRRVK